MNYVKSTWLLSSICFLILRGSIFCKPTRGIANKEVLENVHHTSMHRHPRSITPRLNSEELNADYWRKIGKDAVLEKLKLKENTNLAKNIIMFLGDGMSIPTLSVARIYKGQLDGKPGEEGKLAWEDFPYTGLSKTYCVDAQVADSACSGTAYMTGVKANIDTIGVSPNVKLGDCLGMANQSNHLYSIQKWFQDAGRSSGIVTNTRITHASPAASYAHVANRKWESDDSIVASQGDPNVCRDIAYQMINNDVEKERRGEGSFCPTQPWILDGANLIQEWQDRREAEGNTYSYITDRSGLLNISEDLDYVLGLFAYNNFPYHIDSDPQITPRLAEMTEVALKVLSKNQKGFFLFVEGGLIDQAHHDTKAHKAADETVEFSKAVEVAMGMVNLEDTLIVVTADHAHTMSFSGFAPRGNPIFGIAGWSNKDHLPYPTLSYANGMGYYTSFDSSGQRRNLTLDTMEDKDYMFPATVPNYPEAHGGDDVAVFAIGPWAHLFTGTYEQNVIPHLTAFAANICELENCK